MRYWDSSALLPILAQENDTERRRQQLQADPQIVTWWASRVECASALNRLHQEAVLEDGPFERVLGDLETLSSGWIEIQATEKLRQRALRLLRLHSLHAADAMQLAAALPAVKARRPFLSSAATTASTTRREKRVFRSLPEPAKPRRDVKALGPGHSVP